ncbi:MAG: PAQR family membrane homeostasis protein TrhA [Phototrophicaceae bacterium]
MTYLLARIVQFREPTSSLSHFIAGLVSIVGLVVLLATAWGDPLRVLVVGVYGLSTVAIFISSGIYHMVNADHDTLNRLVKADRVSIFLQIAGTYTPFCALYLTGGWRVAMLVLIWGMALAGSIYVIRFYVRGISRKLYSTIFYVAMGCAGLAAVPELAQTLPQGASILLLMGGGFYLTGAIVYSLNAPTLHPRYLNAHDLWHFFVIGGSLCHFIAVLLYAAVG